MIASIGMASNSTATSKDLIIWMSGYNKDPARHRALLYRLEPIDSYALKKHTTLMYKRNRQHAAGA